MHGSLKEDFWVVKLDGTGTLQWQQALGSTEFEEARSVDQTKDGGYVVAGWSGFANNDNGDVTGIHGDYDVWIVKLSETAHAAVMQTLPVIKNLSFTLSPNPARSFIQVDIISDNPTVVLRITNSHGNMVMEKNLSINNKLQLQLDVSRFLAGTYYVTISSGNNTVSRQFVKE